MVSIKSLVPFVIGASLAGCGTYVPELQEFPFDSVDGQHLVQAIVKNVTCEVQDAINDVIRKDLDDVRTKLVKQRKTSWLDGWGVQMTLNLTVDERGAISPTVNWFPPSPASAIFNVSAGANLSTDATRIDKLNSYYTVQELVARGYCDPASRPGGLFLMQSDLKLKQWLLDNVMVGGMGEVVFPSSKDGPFKQNVISHEVKFEVVSAGTATPAWKLARVSINPSGPFLSAGRTRTHDLLITLGPADQPIVVGIVKGQSGPAAVATGRSAPSAAAANSHLASEIGLAVANAIKTTTP